MGGVIYSGKRCFPKEQRSTYLPEAWDRPVLAAKLSETPAALMRLLALGATGFLGPHVLRLLMQQGYHVMVFHRGRTQADLPASIRHLYGDRNVLADLRTAVQQAQPDVVLDVMPYTEEHARLLVHALSGQAGRLVALSSADVYRNYDGLRGHTTSPPDPTPLREDAPLRESLYPYRGHEGLDFDYADTYDKILVERVVMNAPSLAGTVLRLPAVYGPGDRHHRLRPYLQRMDDGRPPILLDERQATWRWTRGYVENVAAAIALAVTDDRAAGHIYNVGKEPTPTEMEWIQQIGSVAGWKGEVVAVPTDQLPTPLCQPLDWRYDLATDTRRLRSALGYTEPVVLDEALQKTIAWERSQSDTTPSQEASSE